MFIVFWDEIFRSSEYSGCRHYVVYDMIPVSEPRLDLQEILQTAGKNGRSTESFAEQWEKGLPRGLGNQPVKPRFSLACKAEVRVWMSGLPAVLDEN